MMPENSTICIGKRCITYGTFDLFHEGHRRLLQRARALGSHLKVAVTTDSSDTARGKLNVRQTLMERIKAVDDSGLADSIIVEEYEGQKVKRSRISKNIGSIYSSLGLIGLVCSTTWASTAELFTSNER
jgi:cytidyltransferase-like protein